MVAEMAASLDHPAALVETPPGRGRYADLMDDSPLTDPDFAALMDRLGPFEPAPRLAVAVSGGADSLALTLLADSWARARGGTVTALTVDHRLRPEAAAEAARVGDWLAKRAIAHHVLVRAGPRPAADLQAAARAARHRLLEEWCAAAGLLHLLLAHHREDQAETLLLRLGRGSGVDGLAAMAPCRPTRWGQILRPLLDIPRARLRATLAARGQDWIEDPSNTDPAYARVRLRGLAPLLAAEGMDAARLAAAADRLGRARAALEAAAARAAAALTRLDPAGFARLDAAGFARLPDEIALRLLARLLAAIGGEPLPPRHPALLRLADTLRGGLGAATLAACALTAAGGSWTLCREAARAEPPVPLPPGGAVWWDRRFRATVAADAPPGLLLGGLGPAPGRALGEAARLLGIPAAARATIPALHDQRGVFAVPRLSYNLAGARAVLRRLEPAPALALTTVGCSLVPAVSAPISRAMSSA
ncbi:tRNA lysidine(34) synthetase TilS [Phaeospirillum tilakii]|uniref:tRNA(Ile)-lysidine synthase n=1 Tax=Phaeospirillum tilakii TaxID=741673 RepID=A0ABW5C772_9PROT